MSKVSIIISVSTLNVFLLYKKLPSPTEFQYESLNVSPSLCPSRAVCWWKLAVSTWVRRCCGMLFRSTARPTKHGAAWVRLCRPWAPARLQTASWQLWSWRPPAPSGPSASSPESSEEVVLEDSGLLLEDALKKMNSNQSLCFKWRFYFILCS